MRTNKLLLTTAVLSAALSVVVGALSPGIASAASITSPDEIKGRSKVVIFFEELKEKDNEVFGSSVVGQPYSKLGLVLPSQMIDADAFVTPEQAVAIRSTGVSQVDNSTFQSLAFTEPKKAVGFSVKSPKATSILVTAMDKTGKVIGETQLGPSEESRFVGFAFDAPDISVVRIVAPHATMGDALTSPTLITGITFNAFGEGDSNDGTSLAGALDFGSGSGVGIVNAGNSSAMASLGGGGFGGRGGGGSSGFNPGRNPGNRNPNLPPSVIPEPAALAVGFFGAAMLLGRRRQSAT